MPAKYFKCPDGESILIDACLSPKGCRMASRCATVPFLRLIGYDREWRGVSPSSAGNGPRYLYLKATRDYIIDPNDRVWAALGTGTHGKLSIHKYTGNVLSEEPLSDEAMKGIADVLEQDEQGNGYILTDYKTFASFKLARALGITITHKEVAIIDEHGEPVYIKSGPNKGKAKTTKESTLTQKPDAADMESEIFQLNRYRIFFESAGFPISRMQIQAIPRDGGTVVARNRGIMRNLYMIPVPRVSDGVILCYYTMLSKEVNEAFKTGYARLCYHGESWGGRRCKGFCEVAEHCKEMGE